MENPKKKGVRQVKIVQVNAVYEAGSTGRTTKEAASQGPGVHLYGTKGDHKIHALASRLTGLQAHNSTHAPRVISLCN